MARILVADDDRMIAHLVSMLLRAKGHEIATAADVAQTLRSARTAPAPDLILLDLHMPDGTGVDVLRELRAHEETKQLPVIMLSGETDAGVRATLESLGIVAFLPKPVQPPGLFDAVARALETA